MKETLAQGHRRRPLRQTTHPASSSNSPPYSLSPVVDGDDALTVEKINKTKLATRNTEISNFGDFFLT